MDKNDFKTLIKINGARNLGLNLERLKYSNSDLERSFSEEWQKENKNVRASTKVMEYFEIILLTKDCIMLLFYVKLRIKKDLSLPPSYNGLVQIADAVSSNGYWINAGIEL